MIRSFAAIAAIFALSAAPLSANPATVRTGDSVEAPELGRTGPMAVGTNASDIALAPSLQLTAQGPAQVARSIGVRFWYPALAFAAPQAIYRHTVPQPGGTRRDIVEYGIARDDAKSAPGKFPVVVISHGFGGWSEHLSRLGEHLASRGYINRSEASRAEARLKKLPKTQKPHFFD